MKNVYCGICEEKQATAASAASRICTSRAASATAAIAGTTSAYLTDLAATAATAGTPTAIRRRNTQHVGPLICGLTAVPAQWFLTVPAVVIEVWLLKCVFSLYWT